MTAINRILVFLAGAIALLSLALSRIGTTPWAHGYDRQNCPGCQAKIDWSKENSRRVSRKQVKEFHDKGMILLPKLLDIDKVQALEQEVDNLPNTIMSDIFGKGLPYRRYEHHLDTRSELVRDWAVNGPL